MPYQRKLSTRQCQRATRTDLKDTHCGRETPTPVRHLRTRYVRTDNDREKKWQDVRIRENKWEAGLQCKVRSM